MNKELIEKVRAKFPRVEKDAMGRKRIFFDAGAGIALDSTFIKVVAWYDNEYGYTCNMLRMVQHVA